MIKSLGSDSLEARDTIKEDDINQKENNENENKVLTKDFSLDQFSTNNRSETTFGSHNIIYLPNKFSNEEHLKNQKPNTVRDIKMSHILNDSLKISQDFKILALKNFEAKKMNEIKIENDENNFLRQTQKKLFIKNSNLDFSIKKKNNIPQRLSIKKNITFNVQKNNNNNFTFKKKIDYPLKSLEKKISNYPFNYKSKYEYFINLSNLSLKNNDNSDNKSNYNSNYCEDNIKSLNYTLGINFLNKNKKSFSKLSSISSEYQVNADLLQKIEETNFIDDTEENIFSNNLFLPKQIDHVSDIKSINQSIQVESEHPFNESVISETDFYANQSYSEITKKNKIQIKNFCFSDHLNYCPTLLLKNYPNLFMNQIRMKERNDKNMFENNKNEDDDVKDIKFEKYYDSKDFEMNKMEENQNINSSYLKYLGSETEFQVLSEKIFSLKNKKLAKYIFQSLRSMDYIDNDNFKAEREKYKLQNL